MLKLYENIKARRKQLKMTQFELASKTGYSDASMISKIERGEVDLSRSKIILFADVLGVDPADLIVFDEKSNKDIESRKVLFEKLNNFSDEDIRKLLVVVDTFF